MALTDIRIPMRRLLPLALLSLFILPEAVAQRAFELGVRAGGGTATLQSTLSGIDNRPGYQVAVFAGVPFSSEAAALVELEYGIRGYRARREELNSEGQVVGIASALNTLHVVSVPVLIRIQPSTPVLGVVPYGLFGPRMDLIAGRQQGSFSQPDGTEQPITLVNELERFSLGATVGGGAAIAAIAGLPIRLEARQSFGFTDLSPENRTIQVTLRAFEVNLVVSF